MSDSMLEKTQGIMDSHFHFNKYAIDCDNGHNNYFGFRPTFSTMEYSVPLGGTVDGARPYYVIKSKWGQNGYEETFEAVTKQDNAHNAYGYVVCPKCGKTLWIKYDVSIINSNGTPQIQD